jgi:hypothetical protein
MDQMEPLQVTLRRARETKNTVRYEEPESDQPIVSGTLYVQQWPCIASRIRRRSQ